MSVDPINKTMLREDLFKLVDDDTFSAIILNELTYKTYRSFDLGDIIEEEKSRQESELEPRNGWIYTNYEAFRDDCLLDCSVETVRRRFDNFIERGWLEKRDSQQPWDRTKEFRLNLLKLSHDLAEIGYSLPYFSLPKSLAPEISSTTNDVMSNSDGESSTSTGGESTSSGEIPLGKEVNKGSKGLGKNITDSSPDGSPSGRRDSEGENEGENSSSEETDGKSASLPHPDELQKNNGKYDYPNCFETAWHSYPDRDGRNAKLAAYRNFRIRLSDGVPLEDLIKATKTYRDFCRKHDRTGTEFVMMAKTFFGADCRFREYTDMDRTQFEVTDPSSMDYEDNQKNAREAFENQPDSLEEFADL